MKNLFYSLFVLFAISLPFPSHAEDQAPQECKVIRVVDGDTVEVPLSCLPKDMKLFVRVLGVDTPEKGWRGKCDSEKALAEKASAHTKKLVAEANSVAVLKGPITWDKFGGRINANIELNGIDLTTSLIENGLAKPYDGGKKTSWCE